MTRVPRPVTERDDGYGSRSLERTSECAWVLRYGAGRDPVRTYLRVLLSLPLLAAYLLRIESIELPLSGGASGRAIAEHVRLRRWGLPRFRIAQGVLVLPEEFASYMRGRSRQALRTNVSRALERGFVCESEMLPSWVRPERDVTQPAPVEHWWARSADGAIVGEAWVTVDDRCALLHSMVCRESYVRWLLHAAIVKSLCDRSCRLLLTNSPDAPLLASGQQHFQRLLGFSVARLRFPRAAPRARPAAVVLAVLVATVAIVIAQTASSPV